MHLTTTTVDAGTATVTATTLDAAAINVRKAKPTWANEGTAERK